MRQTTSRWLVVGLILMAGATAFRWSGQSADEIGVRAALEHYLQGHATGDGAHHRAAFHPEAQLFWVVGDSLRQMTAEQYASNASGRPPADEAQRRRRIVSIDISGTAAIAKVELDYPARYFIDYMSLLKIRGEWKIVNKSFMSTGPRGR